MLSRRVASSGIGVETAESVRASSLGSYLEGFRYRLCQNENEEAEERRRRESLLQDLRGWRPGSRADDRYHKRIRDWKEMASDFLCDLYSLQQAAEAISQRYLDGRRLLFPAHARSLAKLVGVVEELVAGYNDAFGNEAGQAANPMPDELDLARAPNPIDLTTLKEATIPWARQHTAFLADMARAEALDAMGENQAALALMDRHV